MDTTDGHPAHPLPIPRLRLTRHSPTQPVAGPSRLSPRLPVDLNDDDDDDDEPGAQSTPKFTAVPPEVAFPQVHITPAPLETPAARLRALLSRVPNHSATAASHTPAPVSPSEVESDFDIPQSESALATPSIARESLKDLFSRALRDTPQKGRPRRNSIDASEVEASPRVEKERAKYKGKRKSLSDEELDKPSRSSQRSETSFRSSQAATFDLLRERLTNSHINIHDSSPYEDDSNDTEKFARDLNFSHTTPPAATSTPQRSVQMPSRFESNLLEQDSEMQRVMKGLDSYDDSGPSQHQLSFPPVRNANGQSPPAARRPSHIKSHSQDSIHGRQHQTSPRGNGVVHSRSSSRASSLHSTDNNADKEREREWNKPHPKTLHDSSHRHSHSHGSRSVSPMPVVGQSYTLSRKGSAVSLRSFDDDSSARASSRGSQADYRERVDELEREKNIEREREWNKRHPSNKVTRPASSLSLHSERTRTYSHAARPESAHSHVHSDHGGSRRPHSVSPSPGSSRGSSLVSQESVKEQAEEVRHEIQHQQERNWNSPHPKPLQPSSSHSFSSHLHPHSHSPGHVRVRAESLKTSGTRAESPSHHANSSRPPLRSTASHSPANVKDNTSHHVSSTSTEKQTPSRLHRPGSYPARPNSPSPSQHYDDDISGNSPGHTRAWQYPRSRIPLPEHDSPERPALHSRTASSPTPSARPPSRTSGSTRISHIPVRSPKKSHEPPSISTSMSRELNSRNDAKRGHKRTTTELSEGVGRIPSHTNEGPCVPDIHNNAGSDTAPMESTEASRPPTSESEWDDQPQMTTPTIGPLDTPRATTLKLVHNNGDEFRLQKALAPSGISEELSPLPSPPSDFPPSPSPPPPPPTSLLSTPPRRPSFNASRAEFQTPSPPNGFPELPGPPSSEDEVGAATPLKLNGDARDLTAMKTPRPPGAWASTPAPRNTLTRAYSLPEDHEDSHYDSGLATPAASLSRATSLPPQTPALPGGWMATPHRKSILKVRFDVEPSEHSVSEGPSEPSVYVSGDLQDPPWARANPTAGTSQVDGDVTPLPEGNVEGIVRTRTPEPRRNASPVSPRSLRKSPSIRVVDAFGRERKSEGSGKQKESDVADLRSKSTIRVLDAMGREVEEVGAGDRSKSEEDVPLKHNEALARVRQGIADLAEGLSDADRSGEEPLDEQYLNKLDGVSRTARTARHKISQTLQMAQDAEGDLRSKFGSLRASMRKSSFLPNMHTDRRQAWLPTTGWFFWSMVVLQIVLVIIMYRISIARAKNIFLTTYYDPFYPDLHLYTTKPDTRYPSLSSPGSGTRTPWGSLSTLDTLQGDGWKNAATHIWDSFAVAITSWQRQAWEVWGADDHTEDVSWPPT